MKKVTADAGFRDRIRQLADDMDVNLDDILMQSPRRDPLNVGTAADHKKADWFADLWKEAVSQRKDDAIHIRGLHYVIIQMEQDVEPPTSRTSWDRYKNTEKCYDYLISAGTRARILGYVPVGGISDEKNNQERVTEYTGHSTLGDSTPDNLNPTDRLSIPSIPDVNDTAEVRFDDISDELEELRDIANKDIQQDWTDSIYDVVRDIELPEIEMPEGDADPPANPLYDSGRQYLKNVRTIKGSDPRD